MERQSISQSQQPASVGSPLSRGGILQRKSVPREPTIIGKERGHYQSATSFLSHAAVKPLPIQAKLTIGEPGDRYEQEADRIADTIMHIPEPLTEQQSDEEEPALRLNLITETIKPLAQGNSKMPNVQPDLEKCLRANKAGGSPLPKDVRSFMELRFGRNFSQVRAHTDNDSVQMNYELSSRAFTHSNHIYYGVGEAPAKDNLTAHELTHVVQQNDNYLLRQMMPHVEGSSSSESEIPERIATRLAWIDSKISDWEEIVANTVNDFIVNHVLTTITIRANQLTASDSAIVAEASAGGQDIAGALSRTLSLITSIPQLRPLRPVGIPFIAGAWMGEALDEDPASALTALEHGGMESSASRLVDATMVAIRRRVAMVTQDRRNEAARLAREFTGGEDTEAIYERLLIGVFPDLDADMLGMQVPGREVILPMRADLPPEVYDFRAAVREQTNHALHQVFSRSADSARHALRESTTAQQVFSGDEVSSDTLARVERDLGILDISERLASDGEHQPLSIEQRRQFQLIQSRTFNDSWRVRVVAVRAMGELALAEPGGEIKDLVIGELLRMIHDGHEAVRIASAGILTDLHALVAIPELYQLARETNDPRTQAILRGFLERFGEYVGRQED